MDNGNRGRIAAALFLGVIPLVLWALVAVAVGGPTVLYFALGLPAAGGFIGLVILAGWGGHKDPTGLNDPGQRSRRIRGTDGG